MEARFLLSVYPRAMKWKFDSFPYSPPKLDMGFEAGFSRAYLLHFVLPIRFSYGCIRSFKIVY